MIVERACASVCTNYFLPGNNYDMQRQKVSAGGIAGSKKLRFISKLINWDILVHTMDVAMAGT